MTTQDLIFSEQSAWWLSNLQTRKRSPIKASSALAFASHLRVLNKKIGNIPLLEITNKTLRDLVPQLPGGPKTVQCYLSTAKAVVASLLDEDGQAICDRKWNGDFIDIPSIGNQRTPMFDAAQITDILSKANGAGLLYKTAAGSGLRVGELLALEIRHFKDRTLKVEQNLAQDGSITSPKTVNAYREVDLVPSLAGELRDRIGKRQDGFIFGGAVPCLYGTALSRFHSLLDELKIERSGFHGFRRFRKTHLGKVHVPRDLIKYWLGHGKSDVTDLYDQIGTDIEFRLAESARAGLGF